VQAPYSGEVDLPARSEGGDSVKALSRRQLLLMAEKGSCGGLGLMVKEFKLQVRLRDKTRRRLIRYTSRSIETE
jgi:hypothetical protein